MYMKLHITFTGNNYKEKRREKMKKKLLSGLLVATMMLSLLHAPSVEAATKKKPKLSATKLTLTVGKKKTIKIKNYSKLSKKKIKKVKWSASNKKVVSLKVSGKYRQKCRITAKKAGKVTVKVKYNGRTYKCKVTVKAKTTESKTETTTEIAQDHTTEKPTEAVTTEKTTDDSTAETPKEEEPTTEKTTEEPTTEHKHEYGNWSVVTDATCTSEGLQRKTCTCGDFVEEAIPIKEHSFGEWVITKEANCSKKGEKNRVCSVCGSIATEEIDYGSCVYGEWKITSEATCESKGNREKTCKYCRTIIKEEIASTGHSYGIWKIIRNATCTENGAKEIECEICGSTVSEEIASTGHSYELKAKEATCTRDGYTKSVCSVCKDVQNEATLAALGHDYADEYTTVSKNGFRDYGVSAQKCIRCDEYNHETEKAINLADTPTELLGYSYEYMASSGSYSSLESNGCIGSVYGYGSGLTLKLKCDGLDNADTFYDCLLFIHEDAVTIDIYDINGDKLAFRVFEYAERDSLLTEEKFISTYLDIWNNLNYDYTESFVKEILDNQLACLNSDHSWFKTNEEIVYPMEDYIHKNENNYYTYTYIGYEALMIMFHEMGYPVTAIISDYISVQ